MRSKRNKNRNRTSRRNKVQKKNYSRKRRIYKGSGASLSNFLTSWFYPSTMRKIEPWINDYLNEIKNYNLSYDHKKSIPTFWEGVSENTNIEAMKILKEYILRNNSEIINWPGIYSNPNAIDLIIKPIYENNPEQLLEYKTNFCDNPNVYEIIRTEFNRDPSNIPRVCWIFLSRHPNNIELLMENQDKISIRSLCDNTHPLAIEYLTKYYFENNNDYSKPFEVDLLMNENAIDLIDKLYKIKKYKQEILKNTKWLSMNDNAFDFIDRHPEDRDKLINYEGLSGNTSQRAIQMIKDLYNENRKTNKIDWGFLSGNPEAREILEKEYRDYPVKNKLVWKSLSRNPAAINILEEESKREPAMKNRIYNKGLGSNPAIFNTDKKKFLKFTEGLNQNQIQNQNQQSIDPMNYVFGNKDLVRYTSEYL